MRIILATSLLFAFVACASGQQIPKGYTVPDDTLSPDGHYGVTVPILAEHSNGFELPEPKNSLINVKSGQVLATIQTKFIAYGRVGHRGLLPTRWSPDSTLMLWAIDSKWSLETLVLLKIEDGKVVWQIDVLKAAQKAILARTKQGAPNMYAAVKRRNALHGAAKENTPDPDIFPDGFVVDATAVSATGTLNSPTHIWVTLISDVKDLGTFPHLQSWLEGLVDWRGKFTVKDFYYGTGPAIRDDEGNLITTSIQHRNYPGVVD